jgi:DNA-binding NtrC family response regulator
MAESKNTVLVVDDEEYIRRLIIRILNSTGYNVITAAGGKEALQKLAKSPVNLVLLDLRMPDMDGAQTLELIRKRHNIPVIMVTGVGDIPPFGNSAVAGPDGYVKKPFQARELIKCIEDNLPGNGKTEPKTC